MTLYDSCTCLWYQPNYIHSGLITNYLMLTNNGPLIIHACIQIKWETCTYKYCPGSSTIDCNSDFPYIYRYSLKKHIPHDCFYNLSRLWKQQCLWYHLSLNSEVRNGQNVGSVHQHKWNRFQGAESILQESDQLHMGRNLSWCIHKLCCFQILRYTHRI